MGRRPFTKDLYDALATHFRRHPGDHIGAAKVAGCDRRTAKRAWDGPVWIDHPWALPMQQVLHAEEQERTKRIADQEAATRADALSKAEQARKLSSEAEEMNGQILRIARGDVLSGLAGIGRLTSGISKLAERVNKQLETGTRLVNGVEEPLVINVEDALRIMQKFGNTTKQLVDAAEALVNIERLRSNLPTVIVGVPSSKVTLEEAEKNLEVARRSLEKARSLGIVVLEGGKANRG